MVQTRIALRLCLASGPCSIPLHRVYRLVGFATLSGEPNGYFLGWLRFHGEQIPIFDLNLIVCDQPTPEHFGSRILLVEATPNSPARHLGLLAGEVTDTLSPDDPAASQVEALDLDSYLPVLCTMIPKPPEPVPA